MQKSNLNGQARLALKQSLSHGPYLLSVFFLLAHYFKSYPSLVFSKFKGKIFLALKISSRSLACFTELYEAFYSSIGGPRKKVVPADIFNMLTIQGLAQWIAGDGS